MSGSPAQDSVAPPAATGRRTAAAIGGVVVAIASAFASLGGSLVAMAAIGVGWLISRRRERPFTRGRSWLVGVGAVGAVLIGAFGVLVARMPAGTYREIGRTIDSAQAVPPREPPEWLRRITPPNAQQQAPLADAFIKSRAFTVWAGVMGVTFTAGLVAAYAGSLGWAASILLLYAVTGRWLPRAIPPSSR